MKLLRCLSLFVAVLSAGFAAVPIHPWQKQQLTLTAANTYANPYTEVTVWVDLTGPGFHKRIYGFWDGGQTYRIRLVAPAPGAWSWTSGSTPADPGLAGQSGSFDAVAWTAPGL